jgi:hypothetical protein
MWCMIRKQLYISEQHEAALKSQAALSGRNESELLRELLDQLILEPQRISPRFSETRMREIEALSEMVLSDANLSQASSQYQFKREDAYDDDRHHKWDT